MVKAYRESDKDRTEDQALRVKAMEMAIERQRVVGLSFRDSKKVYAPEALETICDAAAIYKFLKDGEV